MNIERNHRTIRNQVGQSLVEVAMAMPVLLLVIAGLVEVSQLVITQNRISTAARNAARFGAQGGEDLGIRNITLNTVTQTLDLTSGYWDVFAMRGELDSDGDLPESSFTWQHIYGDGMTEAYTTTVTTQAWEDLRQEIVDRLDYPGTDPAGLKFVGVLILHDVESVLGLQFMPALVGRNTIRGFSIMRNSALATTVTESEGCEAVYPLAVEQDIRSITQQEFEALNFSYPTTPPPSYNDFPGHRPDKYLLGDAREGDLFMLNVLQGVNNREAALLFWGAEPNNQTTLAESMSYPPNSYMYEEPQDHNDTEIHVGDDIWRSSVNHQQFRNELLPVFQNHIDSRRGLRVPLWDDDEDPAASEVTVTGFAIMRLRGYGWEDGPRGNWILLELTRIDESCGQQ